MAEQADDDRNGLVWFLTELRDFVGLLVNLLGDDDVAEDMFGFSIDVGVISRLDVVQESFTEASLGRPDLVDLAELGGRLAAATEAVELLKQAVEADPRPGVVAEEVLGQFFDAAGLAYVSARWPHFLYVMRLLGLLTDALPQEETADSIEAFGTGFWRVVRWDDVDGLIGDGWRALGGDLQTESDARRLSTLLAVVGLAFAYTKPIVDGLKAMNIDPRTAQVLFGWDPDPGSTTPVADDISRRFVTIMLRLVDETDPQAEPTAETTYDVTVTLAWVPAEHGGPGLWVSLGGGAERDMPLGKGWHFVAGGDLTNGVEMMIPGRSAPDGAGLFRIGSTTGGSLEFRLERRDEGSAGRPAEPWRIGSWLEAKAFELALRLSDQDPMLAGIVRVRDAALSIQRPESGFWHHLVPDGGLRAHVRRRPDRRHQPTIHPRGRFGPHSAHPDPHGHLARAGPAPLPRVPQGRARRRPVRLRGIRRVLPEAGALHGRGGPVRRRPAPGGPRAGRRALVPLPRRDRAEPRRRVRPRWRLPALRPRSRSLLGCAHPDDRPLHGDRLRADHRPGPGLLAAHRPVAHLRTSVHRTPRLRARGSRWRHRPQPRRRREGAAGRGAHGRRPHDAVPRRPGGGGTARADHPVERLPRPAGKLPSRHRREPRLVTRPCLARGRRDRRVGPNVKGSHPRVAGGHCP